MNGLNGMEGRFVLVFYDDGEKIMRKEGCCTTLNEVMIVLDNKIMLPIDRIVRVEVTR